MEDRLVWKERQKVIFIVCFAYILPVIIIFLEWVPFSCRFSILILAAIVILAIARLYRLSSLELGFTHNNLKKSFKVIAPSTLAFALLMVVYYFIQGTRIDNSTYKLAFYLFFVCVSSPIQEFLYRGFLFSIFSRAKFNIWLKILLSASLYSFVHLIYRDVFTLVSTFIIGILWGLHYVKFQNLYSIIFSHALLGTVAILVGLI